MSRNSWTFGKAESNDLCTPSFQLWTHLEGQESLSECRTLSGYHWAIITEMQTCPSEMSSAVGGTQGDQHMVPMLAMQGCGTYCDVTAYFMVESKRKAHAPILRFTKQSHTCMCMHACACAHARTHTHHSSRTDQRILWHSCATIYCDSGKHLSSPCLGFLSYYVTHMSHSHAYIFI